MSLVERSYILCPFLGGSTIGGFTVNLVVFVQLNAYDVRCIEVSGMCLRGYTSMQISELPCHSMLSCLSMHTHTYRTVLFDGPADVFESGMVVDGKPVDWYSSMGKKLAMLMTPSTQMINFRIAHEVGHLKHFDLLPSILLPPFVLVFGYHFSTLLPKCKKQNLPLLWVL